MPEEITTIADDASGSRASVLPSFGFNCFELSLSAGEELTDVLWSVENFASGNEQPSSSGIPILFPFPGRIRGMSFDFGDESYALENDDGYGNAIHGFVHARPWRVIDQAANKVTGEFHAAEDGAGLLDRWPADFRIQATYELQGSSLIATYRVDNPGLEPLPCGLGLHPYFRVPLGSYGSEADCMARLPVAKRWELQDMIATGKLLDVADASHYQAGIRCSEMSFDDVFAGLQFDGEFCTASITDSANGRRLVVSFDETFRECVVYNPPHREAVCIEPYTCVPDCFRLAEEGVDSGARTLEPGESFEALMKIELRAV